MDSSPGDTMLGRVVVLVHDYDEALAFYTAALGATVIHDSVAAGQRLLHIALPAQPIGKLAPVGIWLMRAQEEDRRLVGRQSGSHPLLVLYTDDCAAARDRFVKAGGKETRPLRDEGDTIFTHVVDLYGNEMVLVQLRD